MVRISNTILATVNIIFFIIGVALLCLGVYYHIHIVATTCQTFLQNFLLIFGAIIIVLSLLGVIGSYRGKNNAFLVLYLLLMFLLVLALGALTIFVFFITNAGAGKVVSGKGLKGYRLGDYSHWLQNHFVKGKKWSVFRSCLVDAGACRAFINGSVGSINATDFFKNNFSPIELGCCKPPAECRFLFKNMTFWTADDFSQASSDNSDCATWSNNKDELCYNCNSCKAGFLTNIRKQWRNLVILFLCLLLLVLIIYSIGCCAKNNNKRRHPRHDDV